MKKARSSQPTGGKRGVKLRNAPAQASNTCRLLLAAASPHAPTGKLHRSLGLRALMIEGFLSREQGAWFGRLLAADAAITRIIEVGFNAGHSSCAFLAAREDVTVVSFDLGLHGYVTRAKQYIDKAFPGRHTLVIGDSRETLPRYRADHPAAVFDLAFVDGGHDYDVARADLVTILPMIRPSGLIVMDDVMPWKTFGRGPDRAWSEAKREGLVSEVGLLQDGRPVAAVRHRSVTSAWAVGRPAEKIKPLSGARSAGQ
ncbi:MAG TPA: class I SAM-dependent methyltransferase [Streptosporangiaceae bacterium]|jgi:predicted O-methyltransferase YrrM|nr:class I SAM-dependent methyltransferase [Streptosporangiaceae bacterium]